MLMNLTNMFVFQVLYQSAWGDYGLGVREPELFTYSQLITLIILLSADSFILIIFLFSPPCHPCFQPACPLLSHGVRTVLFLHCSLSFCLLSPRLTLATLPQLCFSSPLFEPGCLSLPLSFLFCVRVPLLQVFRIPRFRIWP